MEGLGAVATALLALGLVAVAVALSLYERLGLQGDIMIAVVRSFVQLTAIGFVIEFIFGLENVGYVALLLLVMVGFGGWTTSRRAEGVPRAFLLAAAAIGLAAVSTIGLLLLLQIVPPTAQYLIPLGGMVIINCINTASLATQVARATRWFWPSIKGIHTAVPNRSPYYRNLQCSGF